MKLRMEHWDEWPIKILYNCSEIHDGILEFYFQPVFPDRLVTVSFDETWNGVSGQIKNI